MAPDLVRDSIFGHFVRLATHGKVFPYPEERDPSIWKQYVDLPKTSNMAHHGDAGVLAEDKQEHPSRTSSNTQYDEESPKELPAEAPTGSAPGEKDGNAITRGLSKIEVDPQKGRDVQIVGWNGENDPEVTTSRLIPHQPNAHNMTESHELVASEEILRHFRDLSVDILRLYRVSNLHRWYRGVTKEFGVSQVAATLGLTLFVAGYGTGTALLHSVCSTLYL